jgi:hypothetical protein
LAIGCAHTARAPSYRKSSSDSERSSIAIVWVAERGERNIAFDAMERWLAALQVSWREFGVSLEEAPGRTKGSRLRRRKT